MVSDIQTFYNDDEASRGLVSVDLVDPASDLGHALTAARKDLNGRQVFIVATGHPIDSGRFADATRRVVAMAEHADLEHIVAALAPEIAIPSAAITEQARRNVILRERLLSEFGVLSARDIADLAGSSAINRGQYAHALMRAGKIFSVVHQRQLLYPAFQFAAETGVALPVIAELLPILRSRLNSDWELAMWFAVQNSWLEGERPVDLLLSNPRALVEAARLGSDRGGF